MEYRTIWTNGYRVRAALFVAIVNETDKALQVQVVDNPKVNLWFPRKALTSVDESQLQLARWFTMNQFTKNIFDRYANHY